MSKTDPLQYDEGVRMAALIIASVFTASGIVIYALGGIGGWFLISMLGAICFLTMHDAVKTDGFWRRAWETVPGIDIDD